LSYQRSGNSLQIQSPDNRNIAPPGHYMLFIINDDGVPSEAAIILVGQPKIRSGQRVVHKAKAAKTDEYELTSTTDDKALLVSILNHAATTNLQITGQATDGRITAQCDVTAAAGESLECRLVNNTTTRWLVKVTAQAETRYDMSGSLSTTPDPMATAPATPNNVIRTGGGTTGIFIVLLVLLRRKNT
ncbi:MAG: galactose oxidase-like domain-containing protein, partial [Pseudomonadota bacterium]